MTILYYLLLSLLTFDYILFLNQEKISIYSRAIENLMTKNGFNYILSTISLSPPCNSWKSIKYYERDHDHENSSFYQ